jgi:hypothetical protein
MEVSGQLHAPALMTGDWVGPRAGQDLVGLPMLEDTTTKYLLLL